MSLYALEHCDRPREKLKALGPQTLTDQELMAILLGQGTRGCDVLALAQRVVRYLNGASLEGLSLEALAKIAGVGPVKAGQILAGYTFWQRRICPPDFRVRDTRDVLSLLAPYAASRQEHFLCVSLTGDMAVLATGVVGIGAVDQVMVHPREVFADPISDRASCVIVAHNHPSGVLEPSVEDRQVTEILKAAGLLLGVPLLDHLIFSSRGCFSFLSAGML